MADKDDDSDNSDDGEHDMDAPKPPKKKRGGKVHGMMPKHRLDKKARGGSIHIKPSHKGLLHKDLGIKKDSPIPEKKLEKAKHSSDAAVRKRAVFAENAKHWNHKK